MSDSIRRSPVTGLAARTGCAIAEDGVVLHFEIHEEPCTKSVEGTVVFTHGITACSDIWLPRTPALSKRARVVIWDQRGHGRSGWGDPDEATIEQTARDLAAVLDATARPDEPIILVGHSMGGMSIIALAALLPNFFRRRVRGVLLLATSCGGLGGNIVRWGHSALTRVGLLNAVVIAAHHSTSLIGDVVWRDSPIARRLIRRYAFHQDLDPTAMDWAIRCLASSRWETVWSFLPGLLAFEGSAGLRVLADVPVTVVGAAHDKITPYTHSTLVAQRIGPDVRLVELALEGHNFVLTRGDVVDNELDRLLSLPSPYPSLRKIVA